MEHNLKTPYQRALITLTGISIFSLLATLAIWGLSSIDLVNDALAWISAIFFFFFSLILFIVWLLGIREVRRTRKFLESDRPFIRWTYSQAEWDQLRKSLWQEEKGDWKITFGCLTALFALVGVLTGIMVGWEDGFSGIITNGLAGLIFGGLAGIILGFLVAGGNYLGAQQSYRQSKPGQVALGAHEIYANGSYFKGDGQVRYIQKAKLHRGTPTTLELLLIFPPRPRMGTEEEWIVPVPAQWVDRVEELLPQLAPGCPFEN